jgi:Rap1a immunity proteins
MIITSLVLGSVFSVTPASWDIGNDLLRACAGTPVQKSFCLGYIEGSADALKAGALPALGARFCLPAGGLTAEQMEAIVIRFLHTHPETLEATALSSIAYALGEKFPCR